MTITGTDSWGDPYDHPFELAVDRVLGSRLRTDSDFCVRLWGSLANLRWENLATGESVGFSWRAAGGFIAAVRGAGGYLDWYCSTDDYGKADPEIAELLAAEGWTPVVDS